MTFNYDLVLGMLHTNRWGLAEHLLLANAGHLQWAALASAIGVPLSSLRTLQGGEVYATFFFIEEQFPRQCPLSSFQVDDRLVFSVSLRAFKNLAVEGTIVFDRADRMASEAVHPTIRLASIFITPERGNGQLRVAPPANGDFSRLPLLPNDENPYHLTKLAEQTEALGLLDDGWCEVEPAGSCDPEYAIDPDRDTNGAGLVYFANYVAFMEAAERQAWSSKAAPIPDSLQHRTLVSRRIAFYGNVDVDDAVRTRVTRYRRDDEPGVMGMKYVVRRRSDDRIICRSEAIKIVPHQAD